MSIIKARDLAYVRMQVPDVEASAKFFADFGLIELSRSDGKIFFRAHGPAQPVLIVEPGSRRLAAIGFVAPNRDSIEQLAQHCGTHVIARTEPGGGFQTSFDDPDGTRLEVVCDIAELSPVAIARQATNDSRDRYRRKGELFRPAAGPAHVLRLGHIVITSPQPLELAAWYREKFGFLLSDEIYIGDEKNILLSFNRADAGDEYVDHHLFQTMPGPASGIHHISFEVLDIDDVYCGNVFLASQGYRHMWGVGRHKQGSQVFDYWIDPSGTMYEHWTDTDLLNAESPPGLSSLEDATGPWGPGMPTEFLTQCT